MKQEYVRSRPEAERNGFGVRRRCGGSLGAYGPDGGKCRHQDNQDSIGMFHHYRS